LELSQDNKQSALSQIVWFDPTEQGRKKMKTLKFLLLSLVLSFVLFLTCSVHRAAAQDDQPPVTPETTKVVPMPPDNFPIHAAYPSTQVPPHALGGPDDYGYTWNDGIAFNWIDATSGVDSGLSGDDQYTGAISIGFDFNFYGVSYDQLYFNTNGLVTFGSGSYAYSNSPIPIQAPPNNLIAVFWDDLAVGESYNSGRVFYQRGGTTPNRFLVIQWYNVTSYCLSACTGLKTFEVILYENGDIVMQYQSMSGLLDGATVGIEDSIGVSGLLYLYNFSGLSNNTTVRFYPPGSTARVDAYPIYQGKFAHANELVSFGISIRNTGNLGVDTYDLTLVSGWTVTLYRSDGVIQLNDSDLDGIIDTGPVNQGSTANIIAKIQVPGGADIGDAITANVTARSSQNTTKSKTINLQTAIPAPFAQVYRDDEDGAMSLYLTQPGGQKAKKTTNSYWWGNDPAVYEGPNGNFAYVWSKGQCIGTNCSLYINNIEYTLLNKYGNTVLGVTELTDNSAATVSTYDSSPTVAIAPDGRIGIIWYRYTYQQVNTTSQYNYNVFFAILDSSGNVTYGPANLTDNIAVGIPRNDPNVPGFYSAQVTATGDNRFVLAWQKYVRVSDCSGDCLLEDIYYAVRDTNGNLVRGITQFTNDATGSSSEAYFAPNLTDLTGNRVLLTWSRSSDGDIYFAVLDSDGNVNKDKTNLVGDGTSFSDQNPDAIQLSDGKIVVGWTGVTDSSNIRFAVIDATYNRIVAPTVLGNSAASTGNDYVSVAADAAGRAILTWVNPEWDNYRNLYYALVNGNGSVLTQPMIFRTSQATTPYLETSNFGYGNTSFSSSITTGVDTAIWSNSSTVRGVLGGKAPVRIDYANYGQATANGVALTATLGGGLTYQGDTSGISPIVTGDFVIWFLPSLNFLDENHFTVNIVVPSTATIGAKYPVSLSLAANETEANPLDNTITIEVMAISQNYLPIIIR
jgi:hypothetical protein